MGLDWVSGHGLGEWAWTGCSGLGLGEWAWTG